MRTAVAEQDARTRRIWKGMKSRCQYAKNPDYPQWGGRGIKVCDAWQTYDQFFADMGYAPDGMWLDRIDTNGNYEPANCRWSSPKEQARNKTNNRVLTHDGKTACLAEWGEYLGISPSTISRRLRLGWSPSDTLTVGVGSQNKMWKLTDVDPAEFVAMRQQGHSFRAIGKHFDVSDAAIRKALKKLEANHATR